MLSLLLLLFAGQSWALPYNPASLAAAAYGHWSLHELSWIGEKVAAARGSDPGSLNEITSFLYNHPAQALGIRYTTCEAWVNAAALCALPGAAPRETLAAHNDEADAVRHFTLSANLACTIGRALTEVFLAANEGPPAKWRNINLMDIHNNYVGMDWARNRRHCNPIGLGNRIARASLEKLSEGELFVLQPGNSLCASRSLRGALPGASRRKEFRDALSRLDRRCAP
jgi:hypothetical protein